MSSSSAQRLVDFDLLPSISQHRIATALRVSFILVEALTLFLVNERDSVYFEKVKIDYKRTMFSGGEFVVILL
jgi:hypothetical protein